MAIADLVYLDSSGFHYPDYATILAALQDDYRSIYGNDIYIDPDSQDGQWIALQAQMYYDTFGICASTILSFSPSTAQGVSLARNVKINGIKKRGATYSTVDVTITGTAGTVITNGIVQDSLGQKWDLPASVTIPPATTITVTATAQLPGPVTAASGTVTKIVTPVDGWVSVTNSTAATQGVAAETDAALRLRQSLSVAIPSMTVLEGITGALANVTGVTGVRGYENDTNATDSRGIPAHSTSFVVEGGDVQDIVNVIGIKRTEGCGSYGTTSGTFYDRYGMPLVINFFRPAAVTVGVKVYITPLSGYSAVYADQIRQAVVDYVNSVGIGNSVILSRLTVAATIPGAAGLTYNINLIETSKNGGPYSAASVSVNFNEKASCIIGDVAVI